MKTSANKISILQHQLACCQHLASAWHDDFARQRRPKQRRPKPRSSASLHNKKDVPLFVPWHQPWHKRNPKQNKKLCGFLHALAGTLENTKVSFADSHTVVLDAGASITLSPYLDDFIGDMQPMQDANIQGIGSGLAAKGIGTARFQLRSRDGSIATLEMHDCLCVPELPTVLLCPQQVIDESTGKDDLFSMSKKGTQLKTGDSVIDMTRDKTSNLPVARTESDPERYKRFLANTAMLKSVASDADDNSVASTGNNTATTVATEASEGDDESIASAEPTCTSCADCQQRCGFCASPDVDTHRLVLEGGEEDNLKPAQRELLKWHCRLNHCDMATVQQWAREGKLPCIDRQM